MKVAADTALPQPEGKVIGVVSCLPSEGKTTVSSNLAVLLAMQGAKVVLIDGDLRNPGLTRSLDVRPTAGLIEAIIDPTQEVPVLHDGSGRLTVLPTVLDHRVSNTSELLVSPRMTRLLSSLRAQCDYIVIDLPPIGPVVDAKAFSHRVDAFLFVVEWGKTSRQLLRRVMVNVPTFYDKCLGVVLNKSDKSKMTLYESSGSLDYSSDALQVLLSGISGRLERFPLVFKIAKFAGRKTTSYLLLGIALVAGCRQGSVKGVPPVGHAQQTRRTRPFEIGSDEVEPSGITHLGRETIGPVGRF